MINTFIILINCFSITINSLFIYKIIPIYKDYLKHKQNELDLQVQKIELLVEDLKIRTQQRRFVYNNSE